jgi:hypothetical protein
MNLVKSIVILFYGLILFGCQTLTPYDYSAIQASKPRSILVIPPMNDTVEVNAPYTFLSSISKPLAEKGYYVFPVAVIDNFMKENGLPAPEEMNAVPLEKLREIIGPDAVLYVHISEWGQKYQIVMSTAVTRAQLKLVDARTGVLLWDAEAYAVQSSDSGGGGIASMLVNALANQIAGSMVDQTKNLSSIANATAISDKQQGLPQGPYLKVSLP